jgi:hypothetical protein
MDIYVSQAFSHQAIRINTLEHLSMLRRNCLGECLEMDEDFRPVPEIAAGEFADDDRMAKDPAFIQQRRQSLVSLPQMGHPQRSVHQDHGSFIPSCGGGS